MSKTNLKALCQQMLTKALKAEGCIISGETAAAELPSTYTAAERGWLNEREAETAAALRKNLFDFLTAHDVFGEEELWDLVKAAGAQKAIRRKDLEAIRAQVQAYGDQLAARRAARPYRTFASSVQDWMDRREREQD